MNVSRQMIVASAAILIALLNGCAEWRTTPDAVDARWGMAVSEMIENQTMYPEHGEEERPVMGHDGRKAEGVIRAYRAPATDLRVGKLPLNYDVESGSSSMSGQ